MSPLQKTIKGILDTNTPVLIQNDNVVKRLVPTSGHYFSKGEMISHIGVVWQYATVGELLIIYNDVSLSCDRSFNKPASEFAALNGKDRYIYGPALITQSWRMSRII